jgi:hypothetical protein
MAVIEVEVIGVRFIHSIVNTQLTNPDHALTSPQGGGSRLWKGP